VFVYRRLPMKKLYMKLFFKMLRPFLDGLRSQRIERFRRLNPLARPGGNVLVGDSITEGFPIEEMYTGEKRVYNRGISGDSTLDVIGRMSESVFELSPARVFLQIGTNDLNLPKPATLDEIAARIDEICSRVVMQLPGTEVVLISVYPVAETASPGIQLEMVSPRTNTMIRDLNRRIADVAVKRGLVYVDLFSRLADASGQLTRAYTTEGLHLTIDGYEVVLKELEPLFV
jgi:lysophospholipase L1-like esterase